MFEGRMNGFFAVALTMAAALTADGALVLVAADGQRLRARRG